MSLSKYMDWRTLVLALLGMAIGVVQLVLLLRDAPMLDHLTGLALGLIFGVAVDRILEAIAPRGRRPRKKAPTGTVECPDCGSVQTDLVTVTGADGVTFPM